MANAHEPAVRNNSVEAELAVLEEMCHGPGKTGTGPIGPPPADSGGPLKKVLQNCTGLSGMSSPVDSSADASVGLSERSEEPVLVVTRPPVCPTLPSEFEENGTKFEGNGDNLSEKSFCSVASSETFNFRLDPLIYGVDPNTLPTACRKHARSLRPFLLALPRLSETVVAKCYAEGRVITQVKSKHSSSSSAKSKSEPSRKSKTPSSKPVKEKSVKKKKEKLKIAISSASSRDSSISSPSSSDDDTSSSRKAPTIGSNKKTLSKKSRDFLASSSSDEGPLDRFTPQMKKIVPPPVTLAEKMANLKKQTEDGIKHKKVKKEKTESKKHKDKSTADSKKNSKSHKTKKGRKESSEVKISQPEVTKPAGDVTDPVLDFSSSLRCEKITENKLLLKIIRSASNDGSKEKKKELSGSDKMVESPAKDIASSPVSSESSRVNRPRAGPKCFLDAAKLYISRDADSVAIFQCVEHMVRQVVRAVDNKWWLQGEEAGISSGEEEAKEVKSEPEPDQLGPPPAELFENEVVIKLHRLTESQLERFSAVRRRSLHAQAVEKQQKEFAKRLEELAQEEERKKRKKAGGSDRPKSEKSHKSSHSEKGHSHSKDLEGLRAVKRPQEAPNSNSVTPDLNVAGDAQPGKPILKNALATPSAPSAKPGDPKASANQKLVPLPFLGDSSSAQARKEERPKPKMPKRSLEKHGYTITTYRKPEVEDKKPTVQPRLDAEQTLRDIFSGTYSRHKPASGPVVSSAPVDPRHKPSTTFASGMLYNRRTAAVHTEFMRSPLERDSSRQGEQRKPGFKAPIFPKIRYVDKQMKDEKEEESKDASDVADSNWVDSPGAEAGSNSPGSPGKPVADPGGSSKKPEEPKSTNPDRPPTPPWIKQILSQVTSVCKGKKNGADDLIEAAAASARKADAERRAARRAANQGAQDFGKLLQWGGGQSVSGESKPTLAKFVDPTEKEKPKIPSLLSSLVNPGQEMTQPLDELSAPTETGAEAPENVPVTAADSYRPDPRERLRGPEAPANSNSRDADSQSRTQRDSHSRERDIRPWERDSHSRSHRDSRERDKRPRERHSPERDARPLDLDLTRSRDRHSRERDRHSQERNSRSHSRVPSPPPRTEAGSSRMPSKGTDVPDRELPPPPPKKQKHWRDQNYDEQYNSAAPPALDTGPAPGTGPAPDVPPLTDLPPFLAQFAGQYRPEASLASPAIGLLPQLISQESNIAGNGPQSVQQQLAHLGQRPDLENDLLESVAALDQLSEEEASQLLAHIAQAMGESGPASNLPAAQPEPVFRPPPASAPAPISISRIRGIFRDLLTDPSSILQRHWEKRKKVIDLLPLLDELERVANLSGAPPDADILKPILEFATELLEESC